MHSIRGGRTPVIRMTVRDLLEKHGMRIVGEVNSEKNVLYLAREGSLQRVILNSGISKLDEFIVMLRIKAIGVGGEILILAL